MLMPLQNDRKDTFFVNDFEDGKASQERINMSLSNFLKHISR